MKHGTAYAKRLKRFYAALKKQSKEVQPSDPTDPLEQLILAILGKETSLGSARRAVERLREVMVDLNELRVSSSREVADLLGPYVPDHRHRAATLCGLLNAVFNRVNCTNLDRLRDMGKTDAKHWLEGLQGIEPYHVAAVMLWSLGGHAIPVDDKLLSFLRRENLVHPQAGLTEVQTFLERHIPPLEAKTFCLLMGAVVRTRPTTRTKTSATVKSDSGSGSARKLTDEDTAESETRNEGN